MSSNTPMSAARPRVVVVVAVAAVVIAASVAVVVGVRALTSEDATAAARQYVDLIASGADADLAELATMTVGDTAALADAAVFLAGADERIDVLSLEDPRDVDEPADLPAGSELEDLVEVDVRYRLGGEEHTWPLLLGRSDGDWRVASPMVGSVAWQEPGLRNVDTDIRLGETLLERRPRVNGGDGGDGGGVQPLYPAVYRAEKRVDPYFASTPAGVSVLPGNPTAEPSLPLVATDVTRKALAADFTTRADSCGGSDAFGQCPFFDLVETVRAGGDPYAPQWWKGLAGEPTITVAAVDDGVTVSGAFRYAGRTGVQTMRFTGTGQIGFEVATRAPTLTALEVRQAG